MPSGEAGGRGHGWSLRTLKGCTGHSAGNKPISSDSWTSLYKLPIEKHSVALQWRVVHGVMAMNEHVEHKDPRTGSHSLFCRTKETLQRRWLGCPRPAGLFSLL